MEHRNGLRSRGSELRTILVRLVSRRAGSEAGIEKAYHVTTGSHEAMAGTGVSVKDCCLSWVFREHWGLDHKKGWNVPRRQHSLTSVTRKLPVFFRLLVGHSFIYLFKKFVFIPN